MFETWVIDVTLYKEDGIFCFVPIEHPNEPNQTLVLGMNVLSDLEHFEQGKVIGVVHLDGDSAVNNFCLQHPEVMKELQEAIGE